MSILPSSGKFCRAAGGSQSSVRSTKTLQGKFLLPKSLGNSLSHPGGSVLPVLLLVGFSEPGLDEHPVMIIPCHCEQPAGNSWISFLGRSFPATQQHRALPLPWKSTGGPENSRNGLLSHSSPFPGGPGVLLVAERPRSSGCFPCALRNIPRAPAENQSWSFLCLAESSSPV